MTEPPHETDGPSPAAGQRDVPAPTDDQPPTEGCDGVEEFVAEGGAPGAGWEPL